MVGGGREFLVKWKGYSTKESTWEPEINILEKGMIKKVLKQPAFGQAAQRETEPAEREAERPKPTRARSSRASAQAASEAARRANIRDMQVL